MKETFSVIEFIVGDEIAMYSVTSMEPRKYHSFYNKVLNISVAKKKRISACPVALWNAVVWDGPNILHHCLTYKVVKSFTGYTFSSEPGLSASSARRLALELRQRLTEALRRDKRIEESKNFTKEYFLTFVNNYASECTEIHHISPSFEGFRRFLNLHLKG